jgi:hypothetical protein
MARTPGARVGVLRFDQAQSDQSPVLIHPLDRVAVQLQLADHGRWGVKPSRAQRRKRHRLLTSTPQLLKRQTMLSLNERHRTDYQHSGRADPGSSRFHRFSASSGRSRHIEHYETPGFSGSNSTAGASIAAMTRGLSVGGRARA